jgi:hypothetical protein
VSVLGIYDNEIDAKESYNFALNQLNRGEEITEKRTRVKKCKYRGVYPFKLAKRTQYCAQISINGKTKHLGLFETEEQAHEAYVKAQKYDK